MPGPTEAALNGPAAGAHRVDAPERLGDRNSASGPVRISEAGGSEQTAAPLEAHTDLDSQLASDSLQPHQEGAAHELRTFQELLENPALRKVFLITDHVGDASEQQVASIVERTTRQDYFRATVSQGIVIDPRHPGKAVVFAAVLDRSDLEPFRNRLRTDFKDRLHEEEVDPAVTLQLADIGQVVALPAHPLADVTIPRSTSLALRAGRHVDHDSVDQALASLTAERDQPTLEQERSRPDGDLVMSSRQRLAKTGETSDTHQANRRSGTAEADSETGADQITAGSGQQSPGAGLARAPGRAGSPSTHLAVDDRHLIVLVWIAQNESG
jgi:hypothetical protein